MTLVFNDEIKGYLLGLRDHFTVFSLGDVGRLQARGARYFEWILANQGFEGTGGNRKGEWFVDIEFSALRTMFMIAPSEYKRTSNFRMRVVDDPIREINDADLGILFRFL